MRAGVIEFRKGRPQPQDYLRVISSCWQSSSAGDFAKRSEEEHFLGGFTQRNRYTRPLFAKIKRTLFEVLKRQWHRLLCSDVEDISIHTDAKGPAESVLFDAIDFETFDEFSGCMGIFDKHEQDFEEQTSHKEKSTREFVQGLTEAVDEFCTVGFSKCKQVGLSAGTLRPEIQTTVKTKTSNAWADGCATAQKSMRVAAGKLFKDGCGHVGRDAMHEVDGCVSKPLERVPETCELLDVWIDRPLSHAQQIRYSPGYKAMYIGAPKKVIAREGPQGGGVQAVFESVSYSGTRKLSKAQTVNRIALSATASVACQADAATHSHTKEEKELAEKNVKSWNPVGGALFGMIGDYLDIGQTLKNKSDKDAMDPAGLPIEARKTRDKLHAFFIKGEILQEEACASLCQVMLRTMQKNHTFFVNGKMLLIGASSTWEECESAKEALKIMSRVQGGADTSKTQTR